MIVCVFLFVAALLTARELLIGYLEERRQKHNIDAT